LYTCRMDYLRRAVELAKASFDAGQFPAGAVLVSKRGAVYESKPSVAHNHGECMVIDMAINAEGSAEGAVVYASMQPCLMCSAKMYWAKVGEVRYVLAKTDVRADYAYENAEDTTAVAKGFFAPLAMTQEPALVPDALAIYNEWVSKIEA
jgi:tRNA(Arg) A34 adenosine deaminase TadA